MRVVALHVVVAAMLAGVQATDQLSRVALVNLINNGSHSWTAGHNEISELGDQAQHLLGARRLSFWGAAFLQQKTSWTPSASFTPVTYDLRSQFPGCQNLNAIKDQAHCASCWSLSVVSAATDRLCIASNGRAQTNLSSHELTACCSYCGSGCDGGWPFYAWHYITKKGLVSGGDYGSREGCQPYEVQPCGGRGNPPCSGNFPTLQCPGSVCTNKAYNKPYFIDKHYGTSAYLVRPLVQNIQLEIMQNGPVVTTMDVYRDFFMYKSGVYQHRYGAYQGVHAIKLIGWGTQGGVEYWLAANSWGRSWGENGFLRIRRGVGESGIEKEVSAGNVLGF